MLNDIQWEECERLVDGEYMTQVDDAGFEAALEGVKLALATHSLLAVLTRAGVIVTNSALEQKAIEYLATFANRDNMRAEGLSENGIKRLYQLNYDDGATVEEDAGGPLEWKLQYDADLAKELKKKH